MTDRDALIDRFIEAMCRLEPAIEKSHSLRLILREWAAILYQRGEASRDLNVDDDDDHCDSCGIRFGNAVRLDVYGDGKTLVCTPECVRYVKQVDRNRHTDNLITERKP